MATSGRMDSVTRHLAIFALDERAKDLLAFIDSQLGFTQLCARALPPTRACDR